MRPHNGTHALDWGILPFVAGHILDSLGVRVFLHRESTIARKQWVQTYLDMNKRDRLYMLRLSQRKTSKNVNSNAQVEVGQKGQGNKMRGSGAP